MANVMVSWGGIPGMSDWFAARSHCQWRSEVRSKRITLLLSLLLIKHYYYYYYAVAESQKRHKKWSTQKTHTSRMDRIHQYKLLLAYILQVTEFCIRTCEAETNSENIRNENKKLMMISHSSEDHETSSFTTVTLVLGCPFTTVNLNQLLLDPYGSERSAPLACLWDSSQVNSSNHIYRCF